MLSEVSWTFPDQHLISMAMGFLFDKQWLLEPALCSYTGKSPSIMLKGLTKQQAFTYALYYGEVSFLNLSLSCLPSHHYLDMFESCHTQHYLLSTTELNLLFSNIFLLIICVTGSHIMHTNHLYFPVLPGLCPLTPTMCLSRPPKDKEKRTRTKHQVQFVQSIQSLEHSQTFGGQSLKFLLYIHPCQQPSIVESYTLASLLQLFELLFHGFFSRLLLLGGFGIEVEIVIEAFHVSLSYMSLQTLISLQKKLPCPFLSAGTWIMDQIALGIW